MPNLEFCITNTLLNTNDYNSKPPQKQELAPHFLKYKDDKTKNKSAAQTNIQVLLCTVLLMVTEERILENTRELVEIQAANKQYLIAPPQNSALW